MFVLYTAMDYRYWDDPSDEFREGMGSLLPLWKFQFEPSRSHAVCEVQWSPFYQDLFAVGYGSCLYLLLYTAPALAHVTPGCNPWRSLVGTLEA